MTVNRLVAFVTMAAFAFGGASMAVADDLVDTAVKAGTFKTLAAALGAAELVDPDAPLSDDTPFPLITDLSPRRFAVTRQCCRRRSADACIASLSAEFTESVRS